MHILPGGDLLQDWYTGNTVILRTGHKHPRETRVYFAACAIWFMPCMDDKWLTEKGDQQHVDLSSEFLCSATLLVTLDTAPLVRFRLSVVHINLFKVVLQIGALFSSHVQASAAMQMLYTSNVAAISFGSLRKGMSDLRVHALQLLAHSHWTSACLLGREFESYLQMVSNPCFPSMSVDLQSRLHKSVP